MTAERDSMTLNEVSLPALGVEERSDEAPRAGRARPTPDPEVVAKPKRRQFSAEYRLRRILEEAERCTQRGEVGRLLRREGLYSSHLAAWRKARRKGSLRELAAKKRGAKPAERNRLDAKVRALEAQVARLQHELHTAHTILDVQGKLPGLSVSIVPPTALQSAVGGGGRTVDGQAFGADQQCGRHRLSQRPEWIHEHPGSHDKHRRQESMTNHTTNTVGIDISKAHLDAHQLPSGRSARFANDATGFEALTVWIGSGVERLVYESTGPWHRAFEEALAGTLPLSRVNAKRENSVLAGRLIEETCHKQGVQPQVLTLHSDRGAPMTSKCTAQLLADLGVTRCRTFFPWYNTEHRHGGIAMLTPDDVHHHRTQSVLDQRGPSAPQLRNFDLHRARHRAHIRCRRAAATPPLDRALHARHARHARRQRASFPVPRARLRSLPHRTSMSEMSLSSKWDGEHQPARIANTLGRCITHSSAPSP